MITLLGCYTMRVSRYTLENGSEIINTYFLTLFILEQSRSTIPKRRNNIINISGALLICHEIQVSFFIETV